MTNHQMIYLKFKKIINSLRKSDKTQEPKSKNIQNIKIIIKKGFLMNKKMKELQQISPHYIPFITRMLQRHRLKHSSF